MKPVSTTNKTPKSKKPAHVRRGKYFKEIDPKTVERLASQGLTLQQICDSLGISDQTLINRKKNNLELLDAIKRGRALGLKEVTNALFEAAVSGNVTAQIWYLKNRCPQEWRDKIEIEIDNNLPAPLVIELPAQIIDVTPEPVPTLGSKKTG